MHNLHKILLFSFLITGTITIFYIIGMHTAKNTDLVYQSVFRTIKKLVVSPSRENVTINTGRKRGCIHPLLNVNDKEYTKLLERDRKVVCNSDENWTRTKKGIVLFSDAAIKTHGAFTCKTQAITRVSDWQNKVADTEIAISNGSAVPCELFYIRCASARGKQYVNIHYSMLHKDSVKARVNDSLEVMNKSGTTGSVPKLNVLIIGLDSVSRLTWHRKMPKSRDYFTSKLNGIELEGYNILGDGTPAALLPILTGKTEEELPNSLKNDPRGKPVDNHPWIWREFRNHGYITHWTEDNPGIATFTYRMRGFTNVPTDFYMRSFYINEGKVRHGSPAYCDGSVKKITTVNDWIYDLFDTFPHTPKFSFTFTSEFSHGSMALDHVDVDTAALLKRLDTSGYLNHTVLIMMSDHGARFTTLRRTVQGKQEERLPYFGFRFPDYFQTRYPKAYENFRKNTQVLTTPFDIHSTLRALLFPDSLHNVTIADLKSREINLFNEIPIERTCVHADVPPHWCACASIASTSTDTKMAKSAADSAVKFLNYLLKDVTDKCETITLNSIKSSKTFEDNKDMLKFKQSLNGGRPDLSDRMSPAKSMIELELVTNPGEAEYLVTAFYHARTKEFTFDPKQVSRVNKYGNHPNCILKTHFDLRPYCYCRKGK